ncbi:hypothetical protein BCR39DRAFT_257660 [Naematelia encephala]|uniref:SET domain-containing protein n=1 Tax=Naematelia encephala TaxID=71784 RepID=A0A1Y2AV27_9TREE|nr:hypothetical protein BCR39DRAFT_257660 [Naematelia encephala]
MLPCGRCQKVVFCSARCYAKNFEEHCLECRALGAVASKESVSAKVRLVVKVLRSGKKGLLKNHELSTLTGGSTISPIAPLAHFVRYFLEDFDTDRIMKFNYNRHGLRDQDDLLRITREIVAAIFPVQNPLGTNIGLCVSPDVSVFKHECASTAFISFPDGVDVEQSMYVVASENFQAGESISISYVDHGLPYHLRDRPLRESGFDHFCMACRGSDPDPRFCAIHDNGCGRIHITRELLLDDTDFR